MLQPRHPLQSKGYCPPHGGNFRRVGFLAIVLFLLNISAFPVQKEDYLTDEEIERMREAQEPAERMKLLDEFLNERLRRAKALKSPDSQREKESKADVAKSKKGVSKEKDSGSPDSSSKNAGKQTEKTFADLMGEYLQCLEEISTNVQNFSSFKLDPKAYLKSLKSLNKSLEEHRQWIDEISGKLGKSEKSVVGDVSEALDELSSDVKASIEKANEELLELKESQKKKNQR